MALENLLGELALDATLQDVKTKLIEVLAELSQKLEPGQSIQISNHPGDYPDSAALTALAAIFNKIIASPATEAKQDELNAKDFATQTTLAALLAKIIAAPATEAKQDASQVTLAAILAKLIAAPATETTLAALLAKLPAMGSAAPSASMPVNLANDITVDPAGTYNVINTNLLTGAVGDWYDASSFHSAAIQIIGSAGISSGQIIFEQTNDITLAAAGNVLPVFEDTTISANPIFAAFSIAASSTRMFNFPVIARYIRVRISTVFVGGTVRASTVLSELPWISSRLNAMQATAANFNVTAIPGNTANTTPWLANQLTPAVSTTGDTGAKVATGNGATQTNATSKGALIVVNLGAIAGTAPTVTFKLQGSADGGTTWLDIPGAATAGLTTTGGAFGIMIYPGITAIASSATPGTITVLNFVLPRTWRVVWTIGGTTPSYTITNIQVNYLI